MSRRFASLSVAARLTLLILVIATVSATSLMVGPLLTYGNGQSTGSTDAGLYRAVVSRVSDGENFYTASVKEQLGRDYPVRPAMTVREPTLAYVVAALGGWRNAVYALVALALFAGLATIKRLESIDTRRSFFLLSGLVVVFALGPYVGPIQATQHECWAGLLILMSLSVRTRERFWLAIALALGACFLRELTAPYLALMAIMAISEHRRREAVAWVLSGVVFVLAYAAHLWEVSQHTSPTDPVSPGWFAHDGLPHLLETIHSTTIASAGPDFVSVLVLVLGMLGWASIRSPFTNRVLSWIVFWAVVTLVIGRPENVVWGFMWTGPLVLGLALAPSAIAHLVRGNERNHGNFVGKSVIPHM